MGAVFDCELHCAGDTWTVRGHVSGGAGAGVVLRSRELVLAVLVSPVALAPSRCRRPPRRAAGSVLPLCTPRVRRSSRRVPAWSWPRVCGCRFGGAALGPGSYTPAGMAGGAAGGGRVRLVEVLIGAVCAGGRRLARVRSEMAGMDPASSLRRLVLQAVDPELLEAVIGSDLAPAWVVPLRAQYVRFQQAYPACREGLAAAARPLAGRRGRCRLAGAPSCPRLSGTRGPACVRACSRVAPRCRPWCSRRSLRAFCVTLCGAAGAPADPGWSCSGACGRRGACRGRLPCRRGAR